MRKARKPRYTDETPIVTSESDVPFGFIRLSQLVPRDGHRAATLQKVLSDAHKFGHLPAVKLVRKISEMKTGAVYVDRVRATEMIEARKAEWAEAEKAKAAPPAVSVHVETADWRQKASEAVREKWKNAETERELTNSLLASIVERLDRLDRLVGTAIKRVEANSDSAVEVLSAMNDLKAAAELRLEVDAAGSMAGSDAGR
jgi:hypothetical protein